MKYYEIHEPYYALIAAEVYVEAVADDDGTLKENIQEVSREHAFGCVWNSALKNKPELSVSKFMRDFDERKNDWLLIDGSLT
ncbi:hypothetical protein [Bacillus swezeyi]|uniref:Uncharacterized protein n=1 Tax=Bacillus swezeyi TaxID=1925020 RepID=A0A5M8RUP7_9BACI|nr:hypothetical protein [Bacillus swezeyi]KAA6450973.1 hypothetical protein DX927_09080 [Bacillus swezeyi]